MLRIGFIGVGNMGCGMAVNLIRNLRKKQTPQQQAAKVKVLVYDAFAPSVKKVLDKVSNVEQSEKEGVSIQVSSYLCFMLSCAGTTSYMLLMCVNY